MAFEAFYNLFTALVWVTTRKTRNAVSEHAGPKCPQVLDPRSAGIAGDRREEICHACSALHDDAMVRLYSEWLKNGQPDPGPFVRRYAVGRALDAHRAAGYVEYDMVQRVDMAVNAKWIVDRLNIFQLALLYDLLLWTRNGDRSEGTIWPLRRLSSHYDLTPADAEAAVAACLDQLRAAKPAWVEVNIERPAARKLGGLGTTESEARALTVASTPEADDGDLTIRAAAALDTVARRVAAGEDAEAALADEVRRRFDLSEEALLRGRDALADLLEDGSLWNEHASCSQ